MYVVEGGNILGDMLELEKVLSGIRAMVPIWSARLFAEWERVLYYEKLASEQVLSGHYITFVAYLFNWTLCCMLESMIV